MQSELIFVSLPAPLQSTASKHTFGKHPVAVVTIEFENNHKIIQAQVTGEALPMTKVCVGSAPQLEEIGTKSYCCTGWGSSGAWDDCKLGRLTNSEILCRGPIILSYLVQWRSHVNCAKRQVPQKCAGLPPAPLTILAMPSRPLPDPAGAEF